MKPITIVIAKYTAILSIAFLINLWILDYSGAHVPENIPSTQIHVRGVIIFLIVLLTLIFSQKEAVKKYSGITIGKLTLVGSIIGLFAEIIFQSVRVFTLEGNRLHYFLIGIIGMTTFDAVMSFFVAYQIKTKNTNRLILFIIILLVLVRIVLYLFPAALG